MDTVHEINGASKSAAARLADMTARIMAPVIGAARVARAASKRGWCMVVRRARVLRPRVTRARARASRRARVSAVASAGSGLADGPEPPPTSPALVRAPEVRS